MDGAVAPSEGVNGSGKRAFCITLLKENETARLDADSPAEFAGILERSQLSWLNFTVDRAEDESEAIAVALGFSAGSIRKVMTRAKSGIEDRGTELAILLPAISVRKLEVQVSPLIILLRKDLIVTVHERDITRFVKFSRYADAFMKKIKPNSPWQDKITIMLHRIMDESNAKNFDHLREIEEQADDLVKHLMDPKTPRETLGPEIYKMKHALIVYMDCLWGTIDVINTLRFGDPDILSDNQQVLARITLLADAVTNQIAISEHMSEVLASGLEVLQSIYNNQLQVLNNRLAMLAAWLAVLGTAILVPNTLATVFGIPAVSDHLEWHEALLVLLVSTVVSVVGVYWFVKSRGLMPEQVE